MIRGGYMFQILIAEDNPSQNFILKKFLTMQGFCPHACFDGKQALECLQNNPIDLMITDILMPRMGGIELVREAKRLYPDLPIILLTALENMEDKRIGFESGADDYLVKPVQMDELVLRVNALLRRCRRIAMKNITHKEVSLQYAEKILKINGQQIHLTKKEFMLLYSLLAVEGRILSRCNLLDEVWGFDSESMERTVDVHINKLREKLKGSSVDIVTVRGLGYKAVLR